MLKQDLPSSERVLQGEFQTPRKQEQSHRGRPSPAQNRLGLVAETLQTNLPLLSKKPQPSPRTDPELLPKHKEAVLSHPTDKSTGQEPFCKILSLNIFMRPPLIKNNESDHKEDRLRDSLAYLSSYEVVCLQEMFDTFSTRKLRLKLLSLKHGFEYFAESEPPSLFATGRI